MEINKNTVFEDREGNNLNRKKIKIVSQTPTEIIADIERADNMSKEGSKIDAETLNNFMAYVNNFVVEERGGTVVLVNNTAAAEVNFDVKTDKVTPAIAGNFASLSADGNLVDSGKSVADIANMMAQKISEYNNLLLNKVYPFNFYVC